MSGITGIDCGVGFAYTTKTIKRIKEKIQNLSAEKEDVERKSKASISNLILSFDDIEIINSEIQEDVMSYGEYINDIYNYYRKLDVEIAQKIINKIAKNSICVTVLKPKEEK